MILFHTLETDTVITVLRSTIAPSKNQLRFINTPATITFIILVLSHFADQSFSASYHILNSMTTSSIFDTTLTIFRAWKRYLSSQSMPPLTKAFDINFPAIFAISIHIQLMVFTSITSTVCISWYVLSTTDQSHANTKLLTNNHIDIIDINKDNLIIFLFFIFFFTTLLLIVTNYIISLCAILCIVTLWCGCILSILVVSISSICICFISCVLD